jgi:hypothetical protein
MLGLSNSETLTLSLDESKSKSSGRLSYTYNSFRISENTHKIEYQNSLSPSPETKLKYKPVPSFENDNIIMILPG